MYMVLFVLHDTSKLDQILDAWNAAGVAGITVYLSTGLARMRNRRALWGEVPLIPSLEDFVRHEENTNRTLITIVETDELVDKVVEATQKITGDLNLPHTGMLAVLPVARAYGLNRREDENANFNR